MDVNQRIKALQKERNWSDYNLAKESQLPESTIGNLFRRKSSPSISTLESICRGFQISLSEFFAEGDLLEITPDIEVLMGGWKKLNPEQKNIIVQLIYVLIKSKEGRD